MERQFDERKMLAEPRLIKNKHAADGNVNITTRNPRNGIALRTMKSGKLCSFAITIIINRQHQFRLPYTGTHISSFANGNHQLLHYIFCLLYKYACQKLLRLAKVEMLVRVAKCID